MNFIKQHWFSILLVAILAYVLLHSQESILKLEQKIDDLEEVNEKLLEQNDKYLIEIDSLSNIDAEIIEKIKYIKIKENEAITAVDTMSVSDLQEYFSKRYSN